MDSRAWRRRRFLSLLGVCVIGSLAGCNSLTGDETPAENTAQNDPTTPETEKPTPDVSISISTQSQPRHLPAIWTDSQDIAEFQAQFSVETSGQPDQITVSNERVQIKQDSEQWNENTVTVYPSQMTPGQQEFTATATAGEQQAQDAATVAKPTPGNHKLDIVPERNEELRSTISENSDEENYLEHRGGFVTSDPVFDTYSSHEQLSFDKVGIDLAAYEWEHDNDYESLAATRDSDMSDFIESLGRDTGNSTIEAIKNGQRAPSGFYPNGNPDQYDAGSFEYHSFRESETLGEALDWVFPYYFNWQSVMTDVGPYSTEDLIYAPTLEQAIEQKGNEDLEVHAWDVELGGGHGNGLIYGKNSDGSEELRVMETVASPVTATADDIQHFPLVEESGYLNPNNDGFSEYWHPLRFGWGDKGPSETYTFGFESRKVNAARVANDIASSTQADGDWPSKVERIAPTTEYMVDFTAKLRNFNNNDVRFQKLYDQAKVLNKLTLDEDNSHVIYGTTENPQYAVVEHHSLLDAIWNDSEGEYDDFDQYLLENPRTSMSTADINPS